MLQRIHEAKSHTSRNQDLCNGCVLFHKEICQTHEYKSQPWDSSLRTAGLAAGPSYTAGWVKARCVSCAGRGKVHNGVAIYKDLAAFRIQG